MRDGSEALHGGADHRQAAGSGGGNGERRRFCSAEAENGLGRNGSLRFSPLRLGSERFPFLPLYAVLALVGFAGENRRDAVSRTSPSQLVASGFRCQSAMLSAWSTSSVLKCVSIDQPTTLRLNASTTTARYRNPLHVGTYVMSATHS